HIEIIRALGATPPHYAHIPLILNRDGTKMSKRDEGARVEYYIWRGYLPAAVRNYLCLLGWSPKDNREKLGIDEIIRIFDLKNIGRSSATFDPDKLHWLNGEYARELSGKVGAIVHPTRLAVTGSNVGPSLYHLLEVLGKEKVLARIDRALSRFQ